MIGESIGKALLVVLAISAVAWGLLSFDYNIFTNLIPEYAIWIYRGLGLIGGWVLYSILKK